MSFVRILKALARSFRRAAGCPCQRSTSRVWCIQLRLIYLSLRRVSIDMETTMPVPGSYRCQLRWAALVARCANLVRQVLTQADYILAWVYLSAAPFPLEHVLLIVLRPSKAAP